MYKLNQLSLLATIGIGLALLTSGNAEAVAATRLFSYTSSDQPLSPQIPAAQYLEQGMMLVQSLRVDSPPLAA